MLTRNNIVHTDIVFFIKYLTVLSIFLVFSIAIADSDYEHQSPVNKSSLDKGTLLVASKTLIDPYFGQTVILLTHYDHEGSRGIVLNRPTGISLTENFPEMASLLPSVNNIYYGGPVAHSRFSLMIGSEINDYPNEILADVYHIDTRFLFGQLDYSEVNSDRIRIYSGYAGWSPGQLENEVKRGDWHLLVASKELVFTDNPQSLWQELIEEASARWVWNENIEKRQIIVNLF